jgi:hypothetical protein
MAFPAEIAESVYVATKFLGLIKTGTQAQVTYNNLDLGIMPVLAGKRSDSI